LGLRATLLLALLLAQGCESEDEVDAEAAAILARVPKGSVFTDAAATVKSLGFSCSAGRYEITDARGRRREAEAHLSCVREERYLLLCTRRTRVDLVQTAGRVSNVLVNVGRFC
jgi:hypothetical protein